MRVTLRWLYKCTCLSDICDQMCLVVSCRRQYSYGVVSKIEGVSCQHYEKMISSSFSVTSTSLINNANMPSTCEWQALWTVYIHVVAQIHSIVSWLLQLTLCIVGTSEKSITWDGCHMCLLRYDILQQWSKSSDENSWWSQQVSNEQEYVCSIGFTVTRDLLHIWWPWRAYQNRSRHTQLC